MKPRVLLVLMLFFIGSSAFAQFGYSNCQSEDQNILSSGFLDATSVLLALRVVVNSPSLQLNFEAISSDGTRSIPINGNRVVAVRIPFHDGQTLVYSTDIKTADLLDAKGHLLGHLNCAFGLEPFPGVFPPSGGQ